MCIRRARRVRVLRQPRAPCLSPEPGGTRPLWPSLPPRERRAAFPTGGCDLARCPEPPERRPPGVRAAPPGVDVASGPAGFARTFVHSPGFATWRVLRTLLRSVRVPCSCTATRMLGPEAPAADGESAVSGGPCPPAPRDLSSGIRSDRAPADTTCAWRSGPVRGAAPSAMWDPEENPCVRRRAGCRAPSPRSPVWLFPRLPPNPAFSHHPTRNPAVLGAGGVSLRDRPPDLSPLREVGAANSESEGRFTPRRPPAKRVRLSVPDGVLQSATRTARPRPWWPGPCRVLTSTARCCERRHGDEPRLRLGETS